MDFTRTEEIIKSIFSKTTIKRGYLADSFDTAAMRTNYSKYKNAMSEYDKVEYHKLLLTDFANTDLALSTMVEARIECLKESSKVYDYIDEEQVAVILQNIRTRITSQYVEKNPYYRIVCGLPDLQDVTPIYVDSKYSNICDTTKAIHTMTDSELSALYINGVLTELAEKYPLLMYIPYLHRRVDIITARDASDFDIIKQGTVEEESRITDLFFNTYNKNKNIFLHRHANTFYQRTTEYYESLMSMMLVWATRIDVIREIHANIDIDYYDDYDLATIFQDYSLKIDEGISKDIRADIAKNINLLVRNRGTNAVLENLADIFNIKNIYNYVIQKLYVNGEPTLRCHAVPVSDMQNMSKYLTREYGYITYGKLVENDKTWADKPISTKTTAEINVAEADEYISTYEKLLNTDFSYIHSKYVSVDNIINMSQMSLDFSLFFNYMLATTNVHQVTVNHRLSNAVMTLPQVYAYLCSLLSTKYKFKDNIVANGSELQYVLGLHDDYLDTDTEYHKYDTIMLHIPIYEDQEITVYEDKEFEELIDVPTPTIVNEEVTTYIDEEVITYEQRQVITYVDKEVITYPDGYEASTIAVTNNVDGYTSAEIFSVLEATGAVASDIAVSTLNNVDGYQSLDVYNTSVSSGTDSASTYSILITVDGYQSAEVYTSGATTTPTPSATYTVENTLDGYQNTEIYTSTPTTPSTGTTSATYSVANTVDGYQSIEVYGNTTTTSGTGTPIITIIKVPVISYITVKVVTIVKKPVITIVPKEVIIMVPTLTKVIRNVPVQKIIQVQIGENIVPETAVHTYTLTEVQITDILRLFEGHFSGTDYMYILQNWITLNPNASFSDFIDTFCSDRQMIYTMKTIIRETYDIGQYHIAQTVLHYMTRMKAKTSVYGNVTTYSAYLKDTVPNLYAYYNDKMINTTDDNWSQIFSDEIVYTLNLISKLIEELDNDLYTNTFSFLEDVRDTQINELKNVLSYLVSYFTSMTMTIKDPEFKYELGDEEDSLLVKEGISSTRSNRYLNKFDGIDETLSMRRKKSISESFEIRDYVAIKYSKFKEKIIGG